MAMVKKLKIPLYIMYPNTKWKDIIIDGVKLKYIVGDNGIVASLHHGEPRILNGHRMINGYIIYCLVDKKTKKEYWELGHRLVAKAFIPIPDDLSNYNIDELEVNHKLPGKENKSNNSIENLEWCTSSGNKIHGYINGIYKDGENHPVAKYSNSQINHVCYLLEKDELSRMQISLKTGVDDCTVGAILSGEQWKSISKSYNFSNRKKKRTLYDEKIINQAIKFISDMNKNKMSFSDIGRKVGMSRSSVWYLYKKYFKINK